MLKVLARCILWLGGWKAVGGIPDDPKAVVIAAPHTSNWDAVWALCYKTVIGLDIKFFAKHALFWFPLGPLLRSLGGIPLDRSRAQSAVQQAVSMFETEDQFYFGLAPEGTRSLRDAWKTGFHRIATEADVPVFLGVLDYRTRQVGIMGRLDLCGDIETDLTRCDDFYAAFKGRWPEKTTPARCAELKRQSCMHEDITHQRTIRSFVRRTGRLTPSQQKALEDLWPSFGLVPGDEPLVPQDVFDRIAPCVLEIGFGNGETLVQQAIENQDKNYIGIEVHKPGVGHCLLKARAANVGNLRLIIHDAIEVLRKQIPLDSLSRVNLYFPDPWPKKRHHKRRIVQPEFLNLVADRLQEGGTLNIATDWADYAEHIDEIFSRSDRFTCTERREHDGEQALDRPRTKFERRGLNKGHRIFDWCFTKKH